MFKQLFRARFLVPLLLLTVPVPVFSLLVRPILLDMKASGSGANSSFEVVNDRNRPIAVEVAVQKLTIPERGEIVLSPDDGEEFQIFPPIASIPAGKKQVFRVKWTGAPDIEQSKLYMFSSSELPVARQADDVSSVQILYSINSVVAVAPVNAKPDISIAHVERVSRDGKAGIEFTFNNAGPAHGYVANSQIKLSIRGGNWESMVDESSEGRAFGIGLVPAKARRVMFIPLEGVPASGELVAEFKPVLGRNRKAY